MDIKETPKDLLWKNISSLPYFRGFLRAVEGGFYDDIEIAEPVLDLGCGDGHFTSVTFANRSIKFLGIDPEFKSLNEARQYSIFSHLVCARGDRLPFSGQYFHNAVSNSVLEHIPEVEAVLDEADRVIKPGGKLVICVPNNNFTSNLSIARFFDGMGLKSLATWYRKLFNKISRHYHPDEPDKWKKRLQNSGFEITESWNYFTPESLTILEWGHYFGLPSWINKKLFNQWILFPSIKNPILSRIYQWLRSHVDNNQKTKNGAYSFFITVRK